jgi:hypothetical protein
LSSRIAKSVRRVGEILRISAEDQIRDYSTRFSALKGLYDAFLKDLLVSSFDDKQATSVAQSFFGTTTVPFAAIDGTQYVQPMFDLLVFFAGSYACHGTITFHKDKSPTVEYGDSLTNRAAAVSTVAPIYINKVPEIDQQFFDPEDGELVIERPLSDQYIIDNSSIASFLMTFSEYFLAYRLAISPVQKTKIILLDRTLGGGHSSFLYDTARRHKWERNMSLLGVTFEGTKLTKEDLAYCRHRVINEDLGLLPSRGDFLRYALLYLLERSPRALAFNDICVKLGIMTDDRRERVIKFLEKAVTEGFVNERRDVYSLRTPYKTAWRRITLMVNHVGNHIFAESLPKDPTESRNRLQIVKDGRFAWLTTLDIAFLTLFSLYMLIEECWKRSILLIGMTKDTAARDFKRQLIPILWRAKLLKMTKERQTLERAPNTDRMILQAVSYFARNELPVPWATIEYDSAFRTMVPDRHRPPRADYVGGARRNRITLEGAFLKSYIQLDAAESDPKLRSNVLLIDRLAYPGYDGTTADNTFTFQHDYGAIEPVRALLYRHNGLPNPLQNLTMRILRSLTSPSIPEAYGHNKPLMVADKVAKFHQGTFSQVITGTSNWITSHPHLRGFIFYLSTFRERRSRIEALRRQASN